MIVWSEYYRFNAEDVETIATSENKEITHPYTLTVYMRSGNTFSINYTDKQSRRSAMLDLSRQIEAEKRQTEGKILNKLYLIQDSANRIDKRQLRIWRQLKELLGLKEEMQNDE